MVAQSTGSVPYIDQARSLSRQHSVIQDQHDPFQHLNQDIYSDNDESDSDGTASPPSELPLSSKRSERQEQPEFEQRGLDTHLSQIFELGGFQPNRIVDDNRPSKKRRIQKDKPSRKIVESRSSSLLKSSVLNLPKSPHNKPRRVLLPLGTFSLPIMTVSMRADVQFFDAHDRL